MDASFSYLTVGLMEGKDRPVSVCSRSVASVAPSWGCSYSAALPALGQPVSTQSCLCKAGAPYLVHLHRDCPVPKGRFQWC